MTDLVTPQARKAGAAGSSPDLAVRRAFYDEPDGISLLECIRMLYQERRLIATVVGVFLISSLFVAFTMKPVYRAETLLAPVADEQNEGASALLGQLGGLAALVGGPITAPKDRTAESIATLRSRSLASDFIRAYQLKPLLFPARWNAGAGTWLKSEKVPTDLDAYDVFDKRVRTVSVDRRTGLVSLAIEWHDPRLAAQWANRLVTEVNERRRAQAIQEAEQTIKYLKQQLAHTSSIEIQQSIYRLIEANTKTIAFANSREDYAFRVIDPAVAPEKRVRPKRLVIVATALLLGTLLAVLIVFLRRAIERERSAASPAVP